MLNLAVLALAALLRWRCPARSGSSFERVLIVPVYGQHLKQILITIGG